MTQDVHVPSAGLGSSSQVPTGSIGITYEDEDEDEVDLRHEELGSSQVHDVPSIQPTQPSGTRRLRPRDPYTPDTDAIGHKGKDKTRRQ